MPETTASDSAVALAVRDAVASLNRVIDAAQAHGLQVSFSVSTWTALRPQKSHVTSVWIERPADWDRDYPGEKL